jgi:hypothetical protein
MVSETPNEQFNHLLQQPTPKPHQNPRKNSTKKSKKKKNNVRTPKQSKTKHDHPLTNNHCVEKQKGTLFAAFWSDSLLTETPKDKSTLSL